jgi:hypothetical protein
VSLPLSYICITYTTVLNGRRNKKIYFNLAIWSVCVSAERMLEWECNCVPVKVSNAENTKYT